MWWIEEIKKSIKSKYLIDFNENKFIFCRARVEKYWMPIIDLWFTLDNDVIRIPYDTRLDYQKFLNSWDEKDLPDWVKLEDLVLPKK